MKKRALPLQKSWPSAANRPASLMTVGILCRIALYYGVAGFGGGYSVLSQLRRDLVERRRLLSAEEFLVLAELSKSLPGTPATNLLALVGQRVGGTKGGAIAAGAFLMPSTTLMIGCGAAYSWVRGATGLSTFFDGMNGAMVGVVGAVTIELGRSALRSKGDIGAAVACGVVLVTHLVSEPVLAAAACFFGAALGFRRAKPGGSPASTPAPPESRPPRSMERLHGILSLVGSGKAWLGSVVTFGSLARVFLPIGVLTFGGGLAMIPAIERVVVVERHWLDPKAFADAIALGQVTPGPVAICATFIGYRVAGVIGALVATFAMFAPATALALAAGHWVERFHSSPLIEGALRMLAPAVIGMLGAATFSLGQAAVGVHIDAVLGLVAFGVLVSRQVSPLWLLLGGGLVRILMHWILLV